MGRASKRKASFHGEAHVKKRVRITLDKGNWKTYKARHHAFIHSSAMEVTSGASSGAKRAKTTEAHMIPGVDGELIFGFPNTIITKLRYHDTIFLPATGISRGINVFAANGLFDPDITGIGHQPMYYDNYTALYNNYCVVGSQIKVEFGATQTAVPVLVGITGDDDSTFSTVANTLAEQNNSVSTLLIGAGGEVETLTMQFEPLKDFGVDVKNDGDSQTTTGTNPTQLWCYGVWAQAIDPAVGAVSTALNIMIEYTVKFSELRSPVQN